MSSNEPSSAEVQREAEAERAELVNTLDQLRENLKPANVIDEVMASAKLTTTDISDKVWQTARENPIPATLIALGAAMLAGVGSRIGSRSGATTSDIRTASPTSGLSAPRSEAIPGGTAGMKAGAEPGGSQWRPSGARGPAPTSSAEVSPGTFRRNAAGFKARLRPASATRTQSGVSAMSYSSFSRDRLSGSLSRLLDEQPLVLAAVGVAIGAAIGAALPSTDTEGRLMGDASVSLKGRAQDLAQSELAHIKETANATLDQLKQNAADHGVSKDNLTSFVQDSGATVRGAVSDVTDHAANTAGLKS